MSGKNFELLDEAAVAAKLGVKPDTLPAWRHRRQGPPYVKIGALVRYRDDQLAAWIESRTRNPQIVDGDEA